MRRWVSRGLTLAAGVALGLLWVALAKGIDSIHINPAVQKHCVACHITRDF